jgi:adenylate cyclase
MDSKSLQATLTYDYSTQQSVRSQLSRILLSSLFRRSPQVSRFLSFVVETALCGQFDHIKQYTIAVDGLNYSPDFNPEINPSVRNTGSRVRFMLERYYLHEGSNDDILIEIPSGTYMPVFRPNSIPQNNTQSGIPTTLSPNSDTDNGLSVAVIPFSVQSPSKKVKAFANSITESIVIGLAHFHQLHVVGPLREYEDCALTKDVITQRYHVRFMLQGYVQIHGNTLRVSVGLTDTDTGFKIWTQTYEYTQTAMNLLEIEDDVSRLVVNALANYSGIIPCFISRVSMKKHSDDLNIYEAISRYEHYLVIFTHQALFDAVEALEHALKNNPDNPIVLAMLSNAYCFNYMFDHGLDTATLEETDHLVQRAIALDPACQLAHIAEALLRFLQRRADQCIAKVRFLISFNPFNAFIIHMSGIYLSQLGYWEEGMHLCNKAMHLNPYYPPAYFIMHSMDSYRQGDYETALSYAKRLNTAFFWDPLIRAATVGQMGRHAEAKAALQELLEMRPDFPSRARDLMARFVYLEEHVEMLLDGLVKAGLELERAPNHTSTRSHSGKVTSIR